MVTGPAVDAETGYDLSVTVSDGALDANAATRLTVTPINEGGEGGSCNTTDPEMFMIGGGVSRAGEVLFAPLREHFKVYAFKSCRETPIVPAILGNDAGIYGSVRLIVGE